MRHRTAAVKLVTRGPINQMQIVTSVAWLLLHTGPMLRDLAVEQYHMVYLNERD